jgi:hypothetical protein
MNSPPPNKRNALDGLDCAAPPKQRLRIEDTLTDGDKNDQSRRLSTDLTSTHRSNSLSRSSLHSSSTSVSIYGDTTITQKRKSVREYTDDASAKRKLMTEEERK